ncbi:Lysophospholipase 2 [Leucoagaricus sp. SymC.cos]|nr:Lysophospholipase 2 [Leucoagaricus sp. SymC.cos]
MFSSRLPLHLVLLSCLLTDLHAQDPPDPFQDSVTDYAPQTNVECPDFSTTSLLRVWTPQNQTLHPREDEYVNTRAQNVLPNAWKDWLGDGSRIGYDLGSLNLTPSAWPKIGITLPGGGLRAAQFAAGALSGLDSRNETAKAAGTGGLLQVASYISGLSGGSWITGSLFFNDFPTLHNLVLGDGNTLDGWKLDLPFATPDGSDLFSKKNQAWYGSIIWSIIAKAQKGIDTSLTDPWARMISYHFLNQTTRANFFTNDSAHGAGQLWSNIPLIPSYQQYLTPFPIIVADSRPVGSNLTTQLDLNPTVYEITPMEIASYDPSLSAGMNLTFAGTHLSNGKPENGSACVLGFDQAGFIMGSSASLFNQILDFAHNTIAGMDDKDAKGLLYTLARQLSQVRTRADDVANWPSPFNGIKQSTFQDANATWLELIDGASNSENVPYGPLFVRKRALDVIVTLESSADQNGFPNGSSPITTAHRLSTLLQSSHQQFPPIPSRPDDFISTGVNARATFFGCDPSSPNDYPMLIYLPNAPPINGDDSITNTATFQLTYTFKHTSLFLDAAQKLVVEGFKPNTNDPDPNFGACLQCAAFDRARMKLSPAPARSDICTQCFKQYCYDPQNPPSRDELPNRSQTFKDPDPHGLSNFLTKNEFNFIGAAIGLVVLIAVLIGGAIWWKKRKDKKFYKRISNTLHTEAFAIQTYPAAHSKSESQVYQPLYEMPNHQGQT